MRIHLFSYSPWLTNFEIRKHISDRYLSETWSGKLQDSRLVLQKKCLIFPRSPGLVVKSYGWARMWFLRLNISFEGKYYHGYCWSKERKMKIMLQRLIPSKLFKIDVSSSRANYILLTVYFVMLCC